jgi:single-strand DNA-binding protein
VNKVYLFGNIGNAPEIRYSPNGTCVANFSLATNYQRKDGEKETTWHKIVAFGKTAELVSTYLDKGSKVLVEGRIQTRSYEAKDGTGTRYITEIVTQQLEFGDQNTGQQRPANGTASERTNNSQPQSQETDWADEDYPF